MELMQHGNMYDNCTKLLFLIASDLHERGLFKISPIWPYKKHSIFHRVHLIGQSFRISFLKHMVHILLQIL
jgi:hypothetical protein